MSRFLVRIVLHYETNYEYLHRAMESIGFTRYIRAESGQLYHLPPGEYYVEANAGLVFVLDKAKHAAATTGLAFYAAATTGLAFSIFASQTYGSMWEGLPPA